MSASVGFALQQVAMGQQLTQIAVLVVCYNGRRFLDDCLGSVLASDDPGIEKIVVVVDNASTDGSAAYVREKFPQVRCLCLPENLGFAGGNNAGWRYVCENHPRAFGLYLLNQDTLVASGFLVAAAEHLRSDPVAGIVQSKLKLFPPEVNRINSAGNRSHYLGFGFVTACGDEDRGRYDQARPIDYASGAACLVRMDLLDRVGLFEEEMFMYLEDVDLSWKLRQIGMEAVYVPASVVYHKSDSAGSLRHYYYLERNRWWVLLVYYRWRTLLLLLPAIVMMEAGQVLFALGRGVLGQKWRAMGWHLRGCNRRRVASLRREAQSRRRLSDGQFLGRFAGAIVAPGFSSSLLTRLGNPLLAGYWALVRRLIRW